jgi:putative ABC transport system substrate-binding protein
VGFGNKGLLGCTASLRCTNPMRTLMRGPPANWYRGGMSSASKGLREGNGDMKFSSIRYGSATFLAATGLLAMAWGNIDAADKIVRLGLLSAAAEPPPQWRERWVFLRTLKELGWIEGQNLTTEARWADGKLERLPELAAELVGLKVDVIIAPSFTPGEAARAATSTIPIALGTCDPYEWIAGSLARPEGNITGQTCMTAETSPKRLQILHEIAPTAKRIAFLYNPAERGPSLALKLSEPAAVALGVTLVRITLQAAAEIDAALAAIASAGADAMFVYQDEVTFRVKAAIIGFANKKKLPSIYSFSEFVDAGGLVSYGPNVGDGFRRLAHQVDKILKGAKPGELPIEQPTQFELILNLKVARELGIDVSQSILLQATRVIE